MSAARYDVVIAGAGLVGMALAAALARDGMTVALLDRQQPPPSADPETWDARVYAISPGSATFLQRVGAWQAVPCERIAAIESMRITGDTGATLDFSAYELGERALAWIVEERALRAALVSAVHAAGVSVRSGVGFESLAWSSGHATLGLTDGTTAQSEPGTTSAPCAPHCGPRFTSRESTSSPASRLQTSHGPPPKRH